MIDFLKCKVIVIGDSNGGKNSLIKKNNNIKFDKNLMENPTIQIRLVKKRNEIENIKINFEILDTIG